jgi:hypothetical protein
VTTWWITFTDPDRALGSQFLGIVLVDGLDFDHAVARCFVLGCHPGGYPRGGPVPDQPEGVKNRLMTPEEAIKAVSTGGALH